MISMFQKHFLNTSLQKYIFSSLVEKFMRFSKIQIQFSKD